MTAIEAAVRRVLTDFGATDEPPKLFTDYLPDGAELVVHVADQLQNDAFMWMADAWGMPRPPCPGHRHPMNARVRDDEAWWTCPASGAGVAVIGTLHG